MKATYTEYFPVVLFIVLYKGILTLKSIIDESLSTSEATQMKPVEQHDAVSFPLKSTLKNERNWSLYLFVQFEMFANLGVKELTLFELKTNLFIPTRGLKKNVTTVEKISTHFKALNAVYSL